MKDTISFKKKKVLKLQYQPILLRISTHSFSFAENWLRQETQSPKQYLFLPMSNKVQLNTVLLSQGQAVFSQPIGPLPGSLGASLKTVITPWTKMHGGGSTVTSTPAAGELRLHHPVCTQISGPGPMGPVDIMTRVSAQQLGTTVTVM